MWKISGRLWAEITLTLLDQQSADMYFLSNSYCCKINFFEIRVCSNTICENHFQLVWQCHVAQKDNRDLHRQRQVTRHNCTRGQAWDYEILWIRAGHVKEEIQFTQTLRHRQWCRCVVFGLSHWWAPWLRVKGQRRADNGAHTTLESDKTLVATSKRRRQKSTVCFHGGTPVHRYWQTHRRSQLHTTNTSTQTHETTQVSDRPREIQRYRE